MFLSERKTEREQNFPCSCSLLKNVHNGQDWTETGARSLEFHLHEWQQPKYFTYILLLSQVH